MNFQPKVKLLEELKVTFDDAADPDGFLPQTVNSKAKSYMGPTNNKTDRVKKFNMKLQEVKNKGKATTLGWAVH